MGRRGEQGAERLINNECTLPFCALPRGREKELSFIMRLATQRPQFNGFYYNLTICPSSKSSAKRPSRRRACSFSKLNRGRVAKEWAQQIYISFA
jgi:hypothetical protein